MQCFPGIKAHPQSLLIESIIMNYCVSQTCLFISGDKPVTSPTAHIGQVPTPIPMVSSPHTPQPVISTANITTTNPNTPVSTVAAGPHTPSPAVASPATCLDSSNLSNDGAKKPEEINSEGFALMDPAKEDPTEEVCGVVRVVVVMMVMVVVMAMVMVMMI